jgi:hypothetical protein
MTYLLFLLAIVVGLGLVATAWAQADPSNLVDLDLVGELLEHAQSGELSWWTVGIVAGGILTVYVLRVAAKALADMLPEAWKRLKAFLLFWTGDFGGVLLVVVANCLGAIATALLDGQKVTPALLWPAFQNAALMVLTYVGARKAIKGIQAKRAQNGAATH